jgi:integrase
LRRAGLRDLRFHDLRHAFGTQVIGTASILKVKEWMGHVDVDTTMSYLHFAPSEADAELVVQAFAPKASDPLAAQLTTGA